MEIKTIVVGPLQTNCYILTKNNQTLIIDPGDEPNKIINEINKIASSTNGVINVNRLRTRVFGNRIFVDIDIQVDPNITVKEGHDISAVLHDRLESEITDIKHTMVHVEPFGNKEEKWQLY